MANQKGIRIQVYEADPIRWVYNLHPDATDCRQYRVSQEEWAVLKAHQEAAKKVQKLLEEISRREEVEEEEAWEEEEKEREGKDAQAEQTPTNPSAPGGDSGHKHG